MAFFGLDEIRRGLFGLATGFAQVHLEVAQIDVSLAVAVGQRACRKILAQRWSSATRPKAWPCLSFSRWQSIQVLVYGRAFSRASAILPPQNSQRP